MAATHVRRIVGDSVPTRTSEREKAEWRAVVDAVARLANSCSSSAQLEDRIAEQSRLLRNPPPAARELRRRPGAGSASRTRLSGMERNRAHRRSCSRLAAKSE